MSTASAASVRPPRCPPDGHLDAAGAVTALYQAHARGLVRLACAILGSQASAEDVVQEAFCGLYLRWDRLSDTGHGLAYVRSSVLNGCRSVVRRRRAHDLDASHHPLEISAEAAAVAHEERRDVMRALRRLPARQRQVLVLRFYLDQSGAEIARVLGISQGTVRSNTSRALIALGRLLGESS
jgi:RNA polymerase sigma-70 factor (sigma-E family)